MRSNLVFFLLASAIGAIVYLLVQLNGNDYLFFAGYTVVQFIVLATAWNILGGLTGYVNFGAAAFFAGDIAALGGVEFLRTLHAEELERVAADLVYAPFAAGEVITRQGAVAHWLYILTEGTAEICVNVDGSPTKVATIEAPGFVGEMGLMTGAPRAATVVACTDVECYRLDKASFDRVLRERPETATEVSHLLAQRTVELEALKDGLDAAAKQRRVEAEKTRLLSTIRAFFALDDDSRVA